MHYLSYLTGYLLICVFIDKALQQIQPAYIRENNQGCLNIPIIGVNLSGTFIITILFKGSAIVCTLARIFDGASPVVEVDDNYKGRVACGLDEDNNRINLCFTSGVSLSDGGKYFGSTSTSSANTLYVMAKPRKPTIVTQNTIIAGTVHTFTCSTTSTSTPAPGLPLTYTWSVNDAPVNDPRFSVTGNGGQTLTIDRVQKQDVGTTARCFAIEEKGLVSEQSDLKTLNVLYVPEVVISPGSNVTTQVDAVNVTLRCLVVDANPNTNLAYTWTKNGNQISTSQTYSILNVQLSDKGTYYCTCSNNAGTSDPAFVTVEVNVVSTISFSVSTISESTTSVFQSTDNTEVSRSSSVSTTSYSTAAGFQTTEIPSSTSSVTTVVNFTTTMLKTTEDSNGVPSSTRFPTTVNEDKENESEAVSSTLLYGAIAGSLSLFFGGLVLFIFLAKRCCKFQGKSRKNNPYVMEDLWRINSHQYTASPFQQISDTQRDNFSHGVPLPDYVVVISDDVYEESSTQNGGLSSDDDPPEYVVISDDVYEESLDPYLTVY